MSTLLILFITLAILISYHHIINTEVTDWYINLSQGRVDAGCCMLFLKQLEDHEKIKYVSLVPDSAEMFDLPFIMNKHQPTYWWYAVWFWDFQARTATMILANEYTEILDEPNGISFK